MDRKQLVAELKEMGIAVKDGKVKKSAIKAALRVLAANADSHQLKIMIDTVKNPDKALLGGPSVKEAIDTLKKKFKYTDMQIKKLQGAVSAELDFEEIAILFRERVQRRL